MTLTPTPKFDEPRYIVDLQSMEYDYPLSKRIAEEITGKGNEGTFCGAAIQLPDGTVVTGENSRLMHAASSLVINATKHLAGLPKTMHLLPRDITDSMRFLKKEILNGRLMRLDLEETLITLSISAISNPAVQEMAVEHLKELRGREVHITHIPTTGDEAGPRKPGVNLTSDPDFSPRSLFIG